MKSLFRHFSSRKNSQQVGHDVSYGCFHLKRKETLVFKKGRKSGLVVRAVPSAISFEDSVKIRSDTVISRVFKSKYNTLFSFRYQITTVVLYRKFEKVTKLIAKHHNPWLNHTEPYNTYLKYCFKIKIWSVSHWNFLDKFLLTRPLCAMNTKTGWNIGSRS